VDLGAGQCMCSCSEAFHSLRPCAVMVVGVAGSMPVHGIGTACFTIYIGGKAHILRIYNCMFCHGKDCYNLISVSQLLRTGQSEVVFSQLDARIKVGDKCVPLEEQKGLYELRAYPLSGDHQVEIPYVNITMEDDPRLWEQDDSPQVYPGMKAPTKLGIWRCQMLWTTCKVGIQGVQELKTYDNNLNDFCDSYFVPPSQFPAKRTYKTTAVEDMAELSLRFMGIGTDRLRHTLERSRGLTPATKKKGENMSVVPTLNFPQGKWKSGKTPRVSKDKVKNLHRAACSG
jgi:hypothetical protein